MCRGGRRLCRKAGDMPLSTTTPKAAGAVVVGVPECDLPLGKGIPQECPVVEMAVRPLHVSAGGLGGMMVAMGGGRCYWLW
jgi:hypothetical protein